MESQTQSSDHHPQSHSHMTGTKRKRLVLSCLECRRRKLKCDRQLPICSRCTEVGHPELCKYDERLQGHSGDEPEHEPDTQASPKRATHQFQSQSYSHSHIHTHPPIPAQNAPYSDARLSGLEPLPGPLVRREAQVHVQRPEQLEKQIANLEARLAHAHAHAHATSPHEVLPLTPASSNTNTRISVNHDPPTNPHVQPRGHAHSNVPKEPLPDPALVMVRGKGFKTQYRGPSNPSSILSYFPTVYGFLKNLFREHRVLATHKANIQSLPNKSHLLHSQSAPEAIDDTLKSLTPPEARCRHLMQLYFKHFEGVYRILHGPSFWRHFDKLWSGELANTSAFTALLLAAMSCARCLYPDEPISFEGDKSTSAVQAGLWVQAAESFHAMQSHKRTTIIWFQLPCLLLLSKRLSGIKVKRHFVLSQTLIATAVSAGLNRSPSVLGTRITVYEREMRRRLWATMTELELSCSIDWGVPSFSGALFADCEPPSNLNDEDFQEDAAEPPAAQPDNTLTDCSFQRYTHHLKPLRNAISNLVNHPDKHRALGYTELLSYHQLVASKFKDIPSWGSSESSDDEINKAFLLKKAIELQLHQLLIILHLPFAVGSESDPNKNHSRFICVDSATNILSTYERMPQHGFSQMSIFKPNLVRASLCICLLQARSVCNDPVMPGIGGAFQIRQMEKVFDLIEERVLSVGNEFQGFWLLFAASCFIDANQEPAALAAWQNKNTDRIVALFDRICMCQKDKSGDTSNTRQLQPGYDDIENWPTPRRSQDHEFDLPTDNLEILGTADDNLLDGPEAGEWGNWMQEEFGFFSLI